MQKVVETKARKIRIVKTKKEAKEEQMKKKEKKR